jgi:hypothetical protein
VRLDLGWTGAVVTPFALALAVRAAFFWVDVDDVRWPTGIMDDQLYGEHGTVDAPDVPWVLVVGGSTTYHGFERAGLGHAHKLTYPRGFPSDIALALSWTLDHTLPRERWPSRVVWGLSMASVVDRKGEAIHPCATSIARGRPNPRIVDPYASDGLCADLSSRASLAERVGIWFGAIDPWFARRPTTRDLVVSRLRLAWDGRLPDPAPETFEKAGRDEAAFRRNVAAWEQLGVFGPDPLDPVQARGLAEVTRLCAEAGIPLTVVSMPEPSVVRERYDPAGRAAFDALLHAQTDDVLDLWTAIPDGAFFDQAHVNEEGRALLTSALAAHL